MGGIQRKELVVLHKQTQAGQQEHLYDTLYTTVAKRRKVPIRRQFSTQASVGPQGTFSIVVAGKRVLTSIYLVGRSQRCRQMF